ncbi:hypothetical protein ABIQ69_16895 [Agromyces sp. G08B096]|uniref:Integral membrane protein n=1 Tax=Agromyces sp. G08B096 TaxID=3156399 RepID=A0AAU7W7F6_9MICO
MRRDRSAKLARGSAIAVFATFVASLAHTLGGGAAPGAVTIALALAFAVPFAAVVVGVPGRRGGRAGGIRTAVAALGAQVALHALYSLGTGAPVTGVVTAESAGHRHERIVLPPSAGLDAAGLAHPGHLGLLMLLAHAVAAMLTVGFILWAGRVLAGLRTLARGILVAVALVVGAAPLPAAAPRLRTLPRPAVTAARDLHLVSLRHRGPPIGAAAA